jgi:KDO2-lipid IV(A) lauroyltransferase
MTAVLYYLLIIPLSRLPFAVLFVLSDGIAWLLRNVLRYRRKTIRANLKNSFPEKTTKELRRIEKGFYQHFTDIFIETLKIFTISSEEAVRRSTFINSHILEAYKDRDIIITMGHYNNYEFVAVTLAQQMPHLPIGVYSPIKNKFFDEKMRNSRGKFGVKLVSKQQAKRSIKDPDDPAAALCFVTDQSGLTSKKVFWMPFLNQETAVMAGSERYAKMHDAVVFFLDMHKIKRGQYQCKLQLITDDPKSTSSGEITYLHTKRLEKQIRDAPAYWLWSHKRWKKSKTEKNQLPIDLDQLAEKYNQHPLLTDR